MLSSAVKSGAWKTRVGLQVVPPFVDRETMMLLKLPLESWYESHALVPFTVIHGRSAPDWSRRLVVQSSGPVAAAGQRVTDTPSEKLKRWLTMKSRSVRRMVPAEVTST